ncbi:MAG TPA: sigma 54-interacting transcriptional regulator [bacterium]|nr:sigma 54-interacting transcriptional regulator [bacterium]
MEIHTTPEWDPMRDHPRFRKNLFQGFSAHSVVCVPIRAEGIIIGTLLLLNREQDRVFQEADVEFLEQLATITAPFLHNVHKIQEYFAPPIGREKLLARYESLGLLGKSEKFLELLHAIEAATRCDVRVVLEGESGTGKELVARAIHQLSGRSRKKFVPVDCGAIPEHLLESELFGHVKGAFTSAAADRKGLFEGGQRGHPVPG